MIEHLFRLEYIERGNNIWLFRKMAEHYWEMQKKDFPLADISRMIWPDFQVRNVFV